MFSLCNSSCCSWFHGQAANRKGGVQWVQIGVAPLKAPLHNQMIWLDNHPFVCRQGGFISICWFVPKRFRFPVRKQRVRPRGSGWRTVMNCGKLPWFPPFPLREFLRDTCTFRWFLSLSQHVPAPSPEFVHLSKTSGQFWLVSRLSPCSCRLLLIQQSWEGIEVGCESRGGKLNSRQDAGTV